MNIKIKDKTYKVKPEGIAIVLIGLALLIGIVSFSACGPKVNTDSTPTPVIDIDKDYDAKKSAIDTSKYASTILAETDDEGQDYIDSTLFLGDSNTARFNRFLDPKTKKTFTTKANTIGVVGMGIDAISSLACLDTSAGRLTMPQAVRSLQPERVIITFGTNNLYGNSTDATSFISRYEAQIKRIEDAYPSVDIIINSIPPVSKVRAYTNISMTQIDAYNKAIVEMCKKNNWKYLNSAEALKNEKTGYAKDGYLASDGLHFEQKGLAALFEYIKTHAYISDDDRPKPLAAIPTVYGVPDGLIKINPLNDEQFTQEDYEPVEETKQEATPTPETTMDVEEATPTPSITTEVTPTPTSTPAAPTTTICPDGGEYPAGTDCSAHPAPTPVPPDTSTEAGCNAARGVVGCWYNNYCYESVEAAQLQQAIDNCSNSGGVWTEGACVYPEPDPQQAPQG